jgi:hypothetical protein
VFKSCDRNGERAPPKDTNPKMTLDRYANLSPEFVNEQRRVMG